MYVSCAQNKLDEAFALFEKALAIFIKTKGEDCVEAATVTNGMALIKKSQVQYSHG